MITQPQADEAARILARMQETVAEMQRTVDAANEKIKATLAKEGAR